MSTNEFENDENTSNTLTKVEKINKQISLIDKCDFWGGEKDKIRKKVT